MDCLFCKIVAGEIPSAKIYEDDTVLIFKDIAPEAPIHWLAVPKVHIPSPAHINDDNCAIVGHVYAVIAQLAKENGLANGYRVVANCGKDGGQTVEHLHFHIMAGREMTWPAG